VEIHPLDQSQVSGPHRRAIACRALNVRRWDAIVTAWAAGDLAGVDRAWIDVIVDVGSQWGQYDYVCYIGFAA
jgi:hypothetical protein